MIDPDWMLGGERMRVVVANGKTVQNKHTEITRAEQAVHVLSLLGSDVFEGCFKRSTETTDAMRVRALSALLAANGGTLPVSTKSSLMLVFSTTKDDDGKNEVIGFLHLEEVVTEDWAREHCDVSGCVSNWVDEAGDVWSDAFMRKMFLYCEQKKRKPRAMPTRIGLRGVLQRVDARTLFIRRQSRHSDGGPHAITRAHLIGLAEEQQP
jgi:hypothetical protein